MTASPLFGSSSKRLTLLLLAVVVPPAATLIWLGAELLDRDRALAAQREAERRQAAGQALALSLEQSLSAVDRLFGGSPLGPGLIRLVISDAGIEAIPGDRVTWVAASRKLPSPPREAFAEAERLEYRGDAAGALAAYRRLAQSATPALRAGALLRVARVHRRDKHWNAALDAYRALADIPDVSLSEMPADLLARRAWGSVLADAGWGADLVRHATRIEEDLLRGRWALDRVAWEMTIQDLEAWLGRTVAITAERRLFTSVGDALWEQLRVAREAPRAHRRLVLAGGVPVTVLVRPSGDAVEAIAIAPEVLREWTANLASEPHGGPMRVALVADSGELAAGDAIAGTAAPAVTLRPAQTGLPWTVVAEIPAGASGDEFLQRRRLLAAGLAAILLLLAGGSYFLWRVVQKELAVVRLQTDFVSAVSHEFRTPLTSLRHITELLHEDDDMPRERRRTFYEVFNRNTERLHQLVESLLDFARMEEGRKPYQLRAVDAAALVEDVVAEFRRHAGPRGDAIAVDAGSARGIELQADVTAVTNALWNLLDNAVKYSPGGGPIRVTVSADADSVAISVRDHGLGIAKSERQAIFGRFVRGRQAVEHGIRGTGLGLAMVAHIARAHGGVVEVESQQGQGSTFRLVLPCSSTTPAGNVDEYAGA